MPTLMYRDPNDGTFKPLAVPGTGGGGEGADEVIVSDTEPADPAIELWVDLASDGDGGGGAGSTGPTGPTGPAGPIGPTGPAGEGGGGGDVEPYRAHRNVVINGDFSVNQRGFTSSTVSSTYGLDRWMVQSADGTVTFSSVTPALGELPESATAHARVAVAGHSAATARATFSQRVESVRTLSGKTATVSFWAKAASGTPKVAVEIYQNFGSGIGGEVSTAAGVVTLSATWARYSVTVAVPSVAGKTLAAGDHVGINLWTSAGTNFAARASSIGPQDATIDFWGVQVEEGVVATAFEQKSYADELRDCQRYYQHSGTVVGYSDNAAVFHSRNDTSHSGYWGSLPLYVPMRGVPVVTLYSYLGTANRVSSGVTGAPDLVFTTLVQYGRFLTFEIASGGTNVVHANWTASAEL